MLLFRLYFQAGHHLEIRPARCGVISFVATTGGVKDMGGGLIGTPVSVMDGERADEGRGEST